MPISDSAHLPPPTLIALTVSGIIAANIFTPVAVHAAGTDVISVINDYTSTQTWKEYIQSKIDNNWKDSGYVINTSNIHVFAETKTIENNWLESFDNSYLYFVNNSVPDGFTLNNNVFYNNDNTQSYRATGIILTTPPGQARSADITGNLFYANKNILEFGNTGILNLSNYKVTLKDSAFIANQVNRDTGVIDATNSDITILAENSDVIFADNTYTDGSGEAPAIYLTGSSSLTVAAAEGRTVYFDDPISGSSPVSMEINPVNYISGNGGTVTFSTSMTLNTINQGNGILSIEDAGTEVKVNSYTHNGTLQLSKGTSFSTNGNWKMEDGAGFNITGNAAISAPNFTFAQNSFLNFSITDAIDRANPLLEIKQTSGTASSINLSPVYISVTVDAATAADTTLSELTLLHSESGFNGEPASFTSTPNNFFTYTLDTANSFIITAKKDEPDTPTDPDTPNPEPEPEKPLDDYLETLDNMGASASQSQAFGSLFDAYADKDSPWYDDFNSLWQYLQHAPQNEVLSALTSVMPDISPLVIENERGIVNDIKDGVFASPDDKTPLSYNARMYLKVSDTSVDGDPHCDADGFDLDRTSAVLGFEKDIVPAFTLGGGYAYSDSDGDTNKRDIEASTHSVFLSGVFKYENFAVKALLTGGFSDYDEKVNVPALTQFKDSFDVRTLGATVQGGYAFSTSFGTLTPEIGLSYLNLHADSHNGPLGQSFSSADADFLSAYTGLNYAAELLKTETGSLAIEGSLHVAYDLISDGLDRKATLADGSYYYVDGVKPSRTRVIPALDLKYNLNDNFSIAAGFKYATGDDYEDKSWHIGFDLKI